MRVAIGAAALLTFSATSLGGCGPAKPKAKEYQPCAAKTCGDACGLCAPDDATCVETADIKACDKGSACRTFSEAVATCHDPCAGMTCGAPCNPCPPQATHCPMQGGTYACDSSGTCASSNPVCP